ncbi:ABC transporter permease [Occallatibacter savannae]|uniref:ABC transporter permease n=1 Tax=Occallatibacter savannae TaxID=1002691 RepID=UPI000D68880F|nr:ABC transporter permease [Occallatibacter savannae]
MNRVGWLWRNLFRRRAVEEDLGEEIESYVEMLTEEKVAAGMPREAARRAARVELGSAESVKEAVRSVSAGILLRQVWQDLRFAARTLKGQPGFVLVSVITIAMGVGINGSIFSILNSLLLRPLPMPHSGELVSMYQQLSGVDKRAYISGKYRFSLSEYERYRDSNRVFSGLAAYHPELGAVVNDDARETQVQAVSCNYFNVLQPAMELGRGFAAAECTGAGAPNVVVLSDAFWRREFGADPSILGRTIKVNRVPVTVVGVAAPGFSGTDMVEASFWAPLPMMKQLSGVMRDIDFTSNQISWLELVGRRRDGVSTGEVQANLAVIAKAIDHQEPKRSTVLTTSEATMLGAPNKRKALMGAGAVLLIAVGMVLLIACANLANLMLARAIARSKEIAMRLALGASRSRVVRQLVTEALLLAAMGGVLGAVVACWSGAALFGFVLAHLPAEAPPIHLEIHADWRVVGYALGVTVLTGVAFGLLPALRATRPDLNTLLKREGAGLTAGSQRAGRGVLVGGQVALCMVLLLASGLLVRALLRSQTVDPGFTMQNVAVLHYDLGRVGYSKAEARAFNSSLSEKLRAVPGIDGVVPALGTPLGDRHFISVFKAGSQPEQVSPYLEVAPGFFSLLNLPILRGRDFSEGDVARGAKYMILSEAMARALWPGEDPLGKVVEYGPEKAKWEVIGVARDAEVGNLGDSDRKFVYMPPDRADELMMQTVMVHYRGDYGPVSNAMIASGKGIDPALNLTVTKLEENLGPYQAISRLTAGAAGILGFAALSLAMIGLYGTVAYGVSRRTGEIGLRLALGARARDVMSMLVRQAMRPVAIGAGAGVLLCAGVSRVLAGLLFGVSPYDAVTFTAVPGLLVGIACVAAWIPARRALKVDPAVALREN